ncbi:hypothetical protein Pcinc_035864 [Petrolisthes cinctipes]|uniref:DM1 domain-containing protein n=1 Tax=Petrolisthes cinctipes TaxID=88211 RepID=A0AAE1BW42_PETCI|nr:hypothetical protein Pcinc_035864 [Petrolisthes cinctipes]
MDVELIPLKVPPDEGHQIFLRPFKWSGSQEDLEQEIEKKLSPYGPIYRISVHKNKPKYYTVEEKGDMWIAYVIFYSKWDWKKAVSDGRTTIEGSTVYIKRKGASRAFENVPLPLNKAQDLMTYYLGFNCWTSEVVYLERDVDTERDDVLRFVCLVRVRLPREDLCSEGVGVGEVPSDTNTPVSQGGSFSTARRFAFQTAMKAAFSKFIIIKLSNGKITAEVDTTVCEPLLYDPAWDNPVVQVNEITQDPEYEDDSMGLDDISEEDLNALLDVTST